MATSTRVPIEVYLHSCYEPDAEYVDGEIEERPMGDDEHSAWQDAICAWFRQHRNQWNVRIRPELRIQVSATRFRVADVAVIDGSRPREPIATKPPIAVFEVLSPEDTLMRLKRKLEDYNTMGIPQIWVIDPEDGSFSRYQDGELKRSATFTETARGISFQMVEIRALLD